MKTLEPRTRNSYITFSGRDIYVFSLETDESKYFFLRILLVCNAIIKRKAILSDTVKKIDNNQELTQIW